MILILSFFYFGSLFLFLVLGLLGSDGLLPEGPSVVAATLWGHLEDVGV